MKFLNDSAQVRIGLSSIVRVDVVHNLVAVVVHLNFAMRANHFVSVSHNGHPLSPAISPEKYSHDPDEPSSPSREVLSTTYRPAVCITRRGVCLPPPALSEHL